MDDVKRRCLERLPDLPRWVETRDLLALEGSVVVEHAARTGFVVWSDQHRLGAVVGEPDPEALARAGARVPELLAFPENVEATRRVLTRFRAEPATIFSAPERLPTAPPYPCRTVGPGEIAALQHLSAALRDELAEVASAGVTVVAACDGDLPVAFCYVAARTETLWDVSIDTAETHRRRGFATAAVTALMRSMKAEGKTAVWGALASNLASSGLARRLGFSAVDTLWVLTRP